MKKFIPLLLSCLFCLNLDGYCCKPKDWVVSSNNNLCQPTQGSWSVYFTSLGCKNNCEMQILAAGSYVASSCQLKLQAWCELNNWCNNTNDCLPGYVCSASGYPDSFGILNLSLYVGCSCALTNTVTFRLWFPAQTGCMCSTGSCANDAIRWGSWDCVSCICP